MKSILVVDDEPQIAELARDYLEHAASASGSRRPARPRSGGPPRPAGPGRPRPRPAGLDGLDVARAIRRDSSVPIIMLTARDEESTSWSASSSARTTTSPSRSARASWWPGSGPCCAASTPADHAADEVIRAGDLVLDVPRMRTELDGRTIELTPTEFTLLAALARQPGRVFTRSQLLDAVHGVAFESYERAIDAHIKNIRRKLEPDPRRPVYVLTVYGVGYRLADERA